MVAIMVAEVVALKPVVLLVALVAAILAVALVAQAVVRALAMVPIVRVDAVANVMAIACPIVALPVKPVVPVIAIQLALKHALLNVPRHVELAVAPVAVQHAPQQIVKTFLSIGVYK